jgi:hypothetical protein
MSNYHIRVRFRIHRNWFLDHKGSAFDVGPSSGGGSYALSAYDGDSIKEAQWLVLESTGKGFSTKDEAEHAGRRVKNAIAWSSARMRVGIDLGDDKSHGGASEYRKKRAMEKSGIQLLNDRHGLVVYKEDTLHPTHFSSMSVGSQVGKPISDFEDYFLQAVDMDLCLTATETLAFELYGLSHFESAPRARFVTLISAIETISKREPRSAEALKYVEGLIERTQNSGLPSSEIDSLRGSLGGLKRESISKAGRDLVGTLLDSKPYGGEQAKDFFQRCYRIRSELLHDGKPKDGTVNIGLLVVPLDHLVADLLVASTRHRDR